MEGERRFATLSADLGAAIDIHILIIMTPECRSGRFPGLSSCLNPIPEQNSADSHLFLGIARNEYHGIP
jgi:hypothetical protein